MNFRPLHDRVLVKRVEAEEKTSGGIIIPDTAKEKPQEGEVVAAGTGPKSEDGKITPLDVKAGDRILFGKWSGTEVKVDGQDLLIMKESDILGHRRLIQSDGVLSNIPYARSSLNFRIETKEYHTWLRKT